MEEKAEVTYKSRALSRFFFRFPFWPFPLPFRGFLEKEQKQTAK